MDNLKKQVCRCIVGACDETCEHYDVKESCCIGWQEVAEQAEKAFTEYENYKALEEQGKLLKLPCAVGDKVYWVNNWFAVRASGLTNDEWHITESNVSRFFCAELGLFVKMKNGENVSALEFGKTLFLTKEEAEAALSKLQR